MFLNYVIALLAVVLYLHGFFPIPARPSQTWPPNNVTGDSPKYPKAVLVVIDALRLDFISEEKTPFLWSSYRKRGCFSELKVETPTVTLPRIKAITTGNVPQFVDIILNLASPTKVEDSFIHRAHAKGKKLVFYGDDIWVKLFPEEFIRSEGTSSFFVNDFTEVDDNVTRNVRIETQRGDWDLMILHYLGLDHIGHVYGPKSPLIAPKLREMDSVIQEVYRNDTLVIVTGDHGMRDSGGHGGSTFPETHVPFLVLGASCRNSSFAQIDIPANLAILLGFDIPATSIGQLQPSLLNSLTDREFLQALKYNSIVLRGKIDLCEDFIETAHHFSDLFLINGDQKLRDNASELYRTCARRISEELLKSSVRQNLASLLIAGLVSLLILVKILHSFCKISEKLHEQILIVLLLILQFNSQFYVSVFLIFFAFFVLVKNLKQFRVKHLKVIDWSFLTVLSILHPLTLLSSSFLEEEHEFWYFFTTTFIILNTFERKNYQWFLVLLAVRFVRCINQVGDKWASVPDLTDWLLEPQNYPILNVTFATSLTLSFYFNSKLAKTTPSKLLDFLVFVLIYVFRTVGENPLLGRTIWGLIFLKLVSAYSNEGFVTAWVLTVTLLLKPYNGILIPVCLYASKIFHKSLKPQTLVMSHWWLGNLLFFAQGHDNSLASVDISSGYIGLTQYEPVLVFPQVLSHTYALPVLSHLLLFTNPQIGVKKTLSIFIFFRLYIVVTVFLVTFVQRHHLFIWSVFAPKMFVEASHFAFLFIETACYYVKDLIKRYS